MKGRTAKFSKENKNKFKTKRQASKYLNGYGMVYKWREILNCLHPREVGR